MYFVYILYSESIDTFYKGQTKDLNNRITRHNKGLEQSTKTGSPWKLVWSTQKMTRAGAKQLESKLKNLSRSRLIEFMMKHEDGLTDKEIIISD